MSMSTISSKQPRECILPCYRINDLEPLRFVQADTSFAFDASALTMLPTIIAPKDPSPTVSLGQDGAAVVEHVPGKSWDTDRAYDVQSLQEALQAANNEFLRYKTKAENLDQDFLLKSKELDEVKALSRAADSSSQDLVEHKKKLVDENALLLRDNSILDRYAKSLEIEHAIINKRLAAFEAQPPISSAVSGSNLLEGEAEYSRLSGSFDVDRSTSDASGDDEMAVQRKAIDEFAAAGIEEDSEFHDRFQSSFAQRHRPFAVANGRNRPNIFSPEEGGHSPDQPKPPSQDGCEDDISIHSYEASIFSADSTLSSVSSVPDEVRVFVDVFVDLLMSDSVLARLFTHAFGERRIEPARSIRNTRKILKTYSADLKKESKNALHEDAVRFVAYEARHSSRLIATRYDKESTGLKHRHSSLSNVDKIGMVAAYLVNLRNVQSQSHEEEVNPHNDTGQISSDDDMDTRTLRQGQWDKMKYFLLSGIPFQKLRRRMLELVKPDAKQVLIRRLTEKLLDLAFTRRSLRVSISRMSKKPYPLQQKLADQILILAIGLKDECRNTDQEELADFLQAHVGFIASRALDRAETTPEKSAERNLEETSVHDLNRSSEALSQKTQPAEDNLEALESLIHEPRVAKISQQWTFLSRSTSFQRFCRGLEDLAYPTAFTRAEELIAEISRDEGYSDNQQNHLLSVLSEIRLASPRSIDGSVCDRVSVLDRIKNFVESSTGSEWAWWPLGTPEKVSQPGETTLSWKCVSAPEDTITKPTRPWQLKV